MDTALDGEETDNRILQLSSYASLSSRSTSPPRTVTNARSKKQAFQDAAYAENVHSFSSRTPLPSLTKVNASFSCHVFSFSESNYLTASSLQPPKSLKCILGTTGKSFKRFLGLDYLDAGGHADISCLICLSTNTSPCVLSRNHRTIRRCRCVFVRATSWSASSSFKLHGSSADKSQTMSAFRPGPVAARAIAEDDATFWMKIVGIDVGARDLLQVSRVRVGGGMKSG